MKQVQRVATLALALTLIGVPAVTMAQSSSGTGTSSSPAVKDNATDKPSTPSASPSTSGSHSTDKSGAAGQASPAMPMNAEDCKNSGWQKFGLKDEAECLTKVKK